MDEYVVRLSPKKSDAIVEIVIVKQVFSRFFVIVYPFLINAVRMN